MAWAPAEHPERPEHPEVSDIRASLAVGHYVLGRLDVEQAAQMAGMTTAVFQRLVPTNGARPGPGTGEPPPAPLLSVVIPVLDEEAVLLALYGELAPVLDGLGTHEVIFVDDGSSDSSADIILELRRHDPAIKLIRLSRNFGHQAALSAGLDLATGRGVVFMDADLQDPPHLLVELVQRWREGHDVVYAVRTQRKESAGKRLGYFLFYRLLQRLAEVEVPRDAGDYCLIDRRVADAIRALPERNRFLRGLRSWVGFRQVGVAYERPARAAGEVKYTPGRLVKLAVDGLVAFSTVPLRIASYLGFLTAAAGLVYILVAVFARLFLGQVPAGWTSIIAIVLTIGGIQLIVTGVLGEYLARVYGETKARPLYVISETHGITGASSAAVGRPTDRLHTNRTAS